MEQKKRRFNVIDVIAVALIAAVVVFVGYKLLRLRTAAPVEAASVRLHYVVKCEGVDRELYESCRKHLPSQLMASGQLYNGTINDVVMEPYYVLDGSGEWVEDPEHVNLIFTVDAVTEKKAVMINEVGTQEIRIGKDDYILKSEYIEFKSSTIVSVEWSEEENS